jgi:hypothetical protein
MRSSIIYTLHVIRVIKSRKIRWVENIAHMGDIRNAYEVLVRKPEGKEITWET